MKVRRFSTAGSRSGPGGELLVVDRQDEGAGAALLLRELGQVAVAGDAQHLEALGLDGLRQRADAQARGVLGAVVFVDDDDGKAEFHAGVLVGGHPGATIAAEVVREPRSVCNRLRGLSGRTRSTIRGHIHGGGAMADSTVWWLLAGAAVAVELMTGTFYLLMLAIGLAAAALAAHAGAGHAGAAGHGRRRRRRRRRGLAPAARAPSRGAAGRSQSGRQPGHRRDRAGRRLERRTAPRRSATAAPVGPSCPRPRRHARHRACTASGRWSATAWSSRRSDTKKRGKAWKSHSSCSSSPSSSWCGPSRSCRSRTPGWWSAWASTTRR